MVNHKYSTYTLIAILAIFILTGPVLAAFEIVQFRGTDGEGYNIERIGNKPLFVSEDLYLEIQRGNVANMEIIHKFGSNYGLSSTWEPITGTGTYQVPTTAQNLEIVSTSNSDAPSGTGAHIITVQGLNGSWEYNSFNVTLNGTTAVALSEPCLRIYRMFVAESGTYATQSNGSHVGTITLQSIGGADKWAELSLFESFPLGQTEIGAYTIPAGKTGYILSKHLSVDSTKPVDLILFKRENADDITSPYTGTMRAIETNKAITNPISIHTTTPMAILPEKTDIGFMGRVATSGSAEVEFEILLIDN